MDYEALGLKAGIEIHQQLDTREKLFCRCPTTLRGFEEHNGEFQRYLRATESELGEIDRAAEEEMMTMRRFTYYTYDTTCLVENDEEPPAPLNSQALSICLTIAKMTGMHPVEQVHTMRKLVIDGSNTSGFQRTAMVALNGSLPSGARIETICLEEEAAQRVEGDTFSLDRLGIPLIEITTAPDMHTPEEVRDVAAFIGMILRSTGAVKRGLGTIRQDINVSIAQGARVEIKGVQELDLIDEVVRREVVRQKNLLDIRDELVRRGASVDDTSTDVTGIFAGTASTILKKAQHIHAVVLHGFDGLVGKEIQPGRRLGSELADYTKKCGLGGIFHTDELPAYGVTAEEVEHLRNEVSAQPSDCVVLVAGPKKKVLCAVGQVIRRAGMALEGVPEETRRMLEEGSTAYMRPLPGAARMYPETDVLPVLLTGGMWDSLEVPELLSEKIDRFVSDLGLDPALARQICYSDRLPLFEHAVGEGIRPTFAATVLLSTLRELARDGVAVDCLSDAALMEVLQAVEDGQMAKEVTNEVLTAIAAGRPVKEAISEIAPPISGEELTALIRSILDERSEFVQQRGKAALGPIMGVVMKEVRGRADGKIIADILRRELEAMLE